MQALGISGFNHVQSVEIADFAAAITLFLYPEHLMVICSLGSFRLPVCMI